MTRVISLEDIRKAQTVLANAIYETPTTFSRSCSELVGCDVYLKFENQQTTGSFKLRGAFNKISSLTHEEKARGIIASSAGNHAQGVALAASRLGVKATIVMPKSAPIVKVEATRGYGAEVVLSGEVYDDAFEKAQILQQERGLTFVHPFADPLIIAGQGTIGLEIIKAVPDVDTVICPVGGGGLISGVALALKTLKPGVKIIGVQTRAANSMVRSFREGKILEQFGRVVTIADGVAVKKPSPYILENYLKKYVDELVDCSEDEVAEAIVFLLERAKAVVEGSGALPLAALPGLKGRLGKVNVLILSGGNIDLNIIERVVHRGLIRSGRLAELRVAVEDRPGVLKELTPILADQGCNILEVRHDRNQVGIELGGTSIDFVVETAGLQHGVAVRQALIAKGFRLL